MSKLTDIQDSFWREQRLQASRTVAQFANELNKPVDVLLAQFAAAGVHFSCADDLVLDDHKVRLLEWLKSRHPAKPKKKITLRKNPDYSPYGSTWRAVAAGENGAEWKCLSEFAAKVVMANEIHPDEQRLVNLLVAKAMIQNLLPLKRVGRPKEQRTDDLARQVFHAYRRLMDSGYSSEDAAGVLSSRFHKTERQIYRYVQTQREKKLIFQLPISARDGEPQLAISYAMRGPDLSSLTDEDYLDHIDELIATEAKRFPEIKEHDFIDSDSDE